MAARWSHNPKVGRSILSCFRWPQFIDLRLLSSRHCRFHTAPRERHPGANISVLKNNAQEVLSPRCFGKYAKIEQTFRSGGSSAVGSIRSHSPKLQDTGNSIPPPGGGVTQEPTDPYQSPTFKRHFLQCFGQCSHAHHQIKSRTRQAKSNTQSPRVETYAPETTTSCLVSQEQRAKSIKHRAKSQEPRAKSQEPRATQMQTHTHTQAC